MKIDNKRELQQITINHSADIDSKDFLHIYRNFAKEPYCFLTIDTTLPANNPNRFRKNFSNFLSFIKMTLTELVKILDDKIKDLDEEDEDLGLMMIQRTRACISMCHTLPVLMT